MDVNQFPDEQQYLADTIKFLDTEIAKMKARSPARGPYKEDARTLQEMDDKLIADYERIRPRPYFGRVDFSLLDDGDVIRGISVQITFHPTGSTAGPRHLPDSSFMRTPMQLADTVLQRVTYRARFSLSASSR
jgi:hypothetical protein